MTISRERECETGSAAPRFGLARRLGRLAPPGRAALAPGMTAATGFQVIAAACLRDFLRSRSVMRRDRSPEALHQLRVAVRRMRAAISIFAEILAGDRLAHFRGELRWIAAALDLARDLDVLIASADDEVMRAPLRRARAQACTDAIAALTAPRLRALVHDLAEWITAGTWLVAPIDKSRTERPITALAADALDRCRRRVERHGRHWQRLDDDGLHRLRTSVKKLHHATDFFGALFQGDKAGRRRKAFRADLATLQQQLGELHDQAIGAALLAKFDIADTSKHRPRRKPMLADAAKSRDAVIAAKRFWR